MIQLVDVFSPEECLKIRDAVHALRSSWTHRDTQFQQPFYTLGIASYIDAAHDAETYYRDVAVNNPMLKSQFGWVYEKLSRVLGEALGKPIIYDEQLALPGFHIFLASKVFELSVASIHSDLQHHLLNWEGKDTTFEKLISFTVAISLPKWGAGLNIWDLMAPQFEGKSMEEKRTIIQETPKRYVEYCVGKMAVHSGELIHQIAPMKNVSEGDERITLQGHGIQTKDSYLIYW